MPTHAENMAFWANRRKEIVRLSKTMTHRDIANVMEMTPARVGQIIKKENEATKRSGARRRSSK